MKLATQLLSNKNVREETIQDDIFFHSISTITNRREDLAALIRTIWKAFKLLGDDVVELSSGNNLLKIKINEFNENFLEEAKRKPWKITP